jgi:hypothetical protein
MRRDGPGRRVSSDRALPVEASEAGEAADTRRSPCKGNDRPSGATRMGGGSVFSMMTQKPSGGLMPGIRSLAMAVRWGDRIALPGLTDRACSIGPPDPDREDGCEDCESRWGSDGIVPVLPERAHEGR